MFRIEINDPTEAEALSSQNLVCQVTDIVYKVEEFRSPVLVRQYFNFKVSDTWPKIVCQNKNVSSAVRIILTKDAQIKKQENLSVPTVMDHMLHHTKGVQNTKNRHLGNMWSTTIKRMPIQFAKTLPHSLKLQMRHLVSQLSNSQNS